MKYPTGGIVKAVAVPLGTLKPNECPGVRRSGGYL